MAVTPWCAWVETDVSAPAGGDGTPGYRPALEARLGQRLR
jgi:hypothetical protein